MHSIQRHPKIKTGSLEFQDSLIFVNSTDSNEPKLVRLRWLIRQQPALENTVLVQENSFLHNYQTLWKRLNAVTLQNKNCFMVFLDLPIFCKNYRIMGVIKSKLGLHSWLIRQEPTIERTSLGITCQSKSLVQCLIISHFGRVSIQRHHKTKTALMAFLDLLIFCEHLREPTLEYHVSPRLQFPA